MSKVIRFSTEKIDDESERLENVYKQCIDLQKRGKRLQDRYSDWVTSLIEVRRDLIATYRNANQRSRSASPPEYFDNEPDHIEMKLVEPPSFSVSNVDKFKDIIKVVNQASKQVREIAKKHEDDFARITSRVP